MTIGRVIAGERVGRTAENVRQEILAIVDDIVADWEVEGGSEITVDTCLVADLGFGSIDFIYLAVAIEEKYQQPKLGFQDLLMKDGRYVDDLTIGQLINFVTLRLSQPNS